MNRRRDMRDPCRVYFIKPVGLDGPVKIGCSLLPRNRLAAMSAWSHVPLEIAALIVGDEDLERRFHAAFRDQWSHGEWFHASPALNAVIAAVAAGTFDVKALPEGSRLPSKRSGNGWSEYSRLSATMNSRIRALEKRGVDVPRSIRDAAFRYNAGPYFKTIPYQPEDAQVVQEYLRRQGYEPRPIPAPPSQLAEDA